MSIIFDEDELADIVGEEAEVIMRDRSNPLPRAIYAHDLLLIGLQKRGLSDADIDANLAEFGDVAFSSLDVSISGTLENLDGPEFDDYLVSAVVVSDTPEATWRINGEVFNNFTAYMIFIYVVPQSGDGSNATSYIERDL